MTRNTRIKTNNFFYLLNKINTEPILLYVVQKTRSYSTQKIAVVKVK